MLRRVHENDAHSYQVQFMSNKHSWNMLEYGYTWLNRQKTWVPYDPTEVLGCTVCHGARTICRCQLCLSPGIICRLTRGVGRLLSSKTKWFSGSMFIRGMVQPKWGTAASFPEFQNNPKHGTQHKKKRDFQPGSDCIILHHVLKGPIGLL